MGYKIIGAVNINKGYFFIQKSSPSNDSLNDVLDKHNVNLDEYWILKSTRNYKFLKHNEMYDYATIGFFNKNVFSKEHIQLWIDKFQGIAPYLVKIPPVRIIDRIKIIQN